MAETKVIIGPFRRRVFAEGLAVLLGGEPGLVVPQIEDEAEAAAYMSATSPTIVILERREGEDCRPTFLPVSDSVAVILIAQEGQDVQIALRHGTTTLFAALDIASGAVRATHYSRRRRMEFLNFMNRIVAEHPERQNHVILDNLNTHKPKQDRWLRRHPNVHFHVTPTRASWLNQIEIWFSILTDQSLAGASFRSVAELRTHIDNFIEAYNEQAKPFAWTKSQVYHASRTSDSGTS